MLYPPLPLCCLLCTFIEAKWMVENPQCSHRNGVSEPCPFLWCPRALGVENFLGHLSHAHSCSVQYKRQPTWIFRSHVLQTRRLNEDWLPQFPEHWASRSFEQDEQECEQCIETPKQNHYRGAESLGSPYVEFHLRCNVRRVVSSVVSSALESSSAPWSSPWLPRSAVPAPELSVGACV